MPDEYPRWNLLCKKCGVKFYSNMRGPPAPYLNLKAAPNFFTCPNGHTELYFWSDFTFD